jgi:hypothetical protein
VFALIALIHPVACLVLELICFFHGRNDFADIAAIALLSCQDPTGAEFATISPSSSVFVLSPLSLVGQATSMLCRPE